MRNVKSIVTAALALTVICAVVVAGLAATNQLTKDTVAEQQLAATNAACRQVLEADSYTLLDGPWRDGVLEVYEGIIGDTVVGWVVKTETTGKAGGLVVMTGVTTEQIISGVAVVEDNETAGYVDKVIDGGLLRRFQEENTVDVKVVSQATKTSNGVKNGVKLALETVQEVMGRG